MLKLSRDTVNNIGMVLTGALFLYALILGSATFLFWIFWVAEGAETWTDSWARFYVSAISVGLFLGTSFILTVLAYKRAEK